jgi:hypothetical protein
MYPYTSPYPWSTDKYRPDEYFLSTRTLSFRCFKFGVERVRDNMIQQMNSSKLIWFSRQRFLNKTNNY